MLDRYRKTPSVPASRRYAPALGACDLAHLYFRLGGHTTAILIFWAIGKTPIRSGSDLALIQKRGALAQAPLILNNQWCLSRARSRKLFRRCQKAIAAISARGDSSGGITAFPKFGHSRSLPPPPGLRCSSPSRHFGQSKPSGEPRRVKPETGITSWVCQAPLSVARHHSDTSKLNIRVRSRSPVAAQDIGRRHPQQVALGNSW